MIKTTQKLVVITLLASLSLVVSACLKKPNPVVNQNQNVNQNTNTTSTTTGEIDTSNWKTYRNEEYGFEFEYPEEWKILKNDLRINIPDKTFGFWLPNTWYLYFDTEIVKNDQHVPIHIFFEDCFQTGIGCQYNLSTPIFTKGNLYVFHDESNSGATWDIAKISLSGTSPKINTLFSVTYIYDLNEGAGYYKDYIGSETRNYLSQLLFNVIKTIRFTN